VAERKAQIIFTGMGAGIAPLARSAGMLWID